MENELASNQLFPNTLQYRIHNVLVNHDFDIFKNTRKKEKKNRKKLKIIHKISLFVVGVDFKAVPFRLE